jgi:hypothetical protein
VGAPSATGSLANGAPSVRTGCTSTTLVVLANYAVGRALVRTLSDAGVQCVPPLLPAPSAKIDGASHALPSDPTRPLSAGFRLNCPGSADASPKPVFVAAAQLWLV